MFSHVLSEHLKCKILFSYSIHKKYINIIYVFCLLPLLSCLMTATHKKAHKQENDKLKKRTCVAREIFFLVDKFSCCCPCFPSQKAKKKTRWKSVKEKWRECQESEVRKIWRFDAFLSLSLRFFFWLATFAMNENLYYCLPLLFASAIITGQAKKEKRKRNTISNNIAVAQPTKRTCLLE